ncbi:MAG: hypothetical protein Kow00109_10050 [Acidobacteriota bacterium]
MADSIPEITVLIAARNAAATIGRALRSVADQPYAQILLLDHASDDGTAEAARDCGLRDLEILTLPADWTLGRVRQAGLEAVRTPLGIWLDADDAFEPDRISTLAGVLERGDSVLAFDEAHLFDGITGRALRRLTFPPELRYPDDLARCFGRNLLPAIGVPAFRTEFARTVGYDAEFHGAEDYDFLLRALLRDTRISLVRAPKYRIYAYPSSLSRRLDRQREMSARALAKHDPDRVAAKLDDSGLEPAERLWVLVEFFVFRREFHRALEALDRLERIAPPASDRQSSWRTRFQRGTLQLFLGDAQAAYPHLEAAATLSATAESWNNLAVAWRDLGEHDRASVAFLRALELFPAYRDAKANLENPQARYITPLPLRQSPSRFEY